jgi:signal recognition particle GTPase
VARCASKDIQIGRLEKQLKKETVEKLKAQLASKDIQMDRLEKLLKKQQERAITAKQAIAEALPVLRLAENTLEIAAHDM